MTEPLKPGQKFPTPTKGFGDRVFYETLLRQRPDSVMAQEWCVAYGVLPKKEAKRLSEAILERKRTGKAAAGLTSPIRPAPEKKKKKRKKVLHDDADDGGPDLQQSGGESVGRIVL
mmetsp:Transcript_3577/g.9878  ORF Transcript_3577/g.9878 Transcript_3577/m.9878 type:complete len:116 (+) Transcript_3577:89-436(+)